MTLRTPTLSILPLSKMSLVSCGVSLADRQCRLWQGWWPPFNRVSISCPGCLISKTFTSPVYQYGLVTLSLPLDLKRTNLPASPHNNDCSLHYSRNKTKRPHQFETIRLAAYSVRQQWRVFDQMRRRESDCLVVSHRE